MLALVRGVGGKQHEVVPAPLRGDCVQNHGQGPFKDPARVREDLVLLGDCWRLGRCCGGSCWICDRLGQLPHRAVLLPPDVGGAAHGVVRG